MFKRKNILYGLTVWSFLTVPMLALAADNNKSIWGEVGLGVEVAVGKYGTDTQTTFVAVPLTITVFPADRLDFEIVVPWVTQSNSNTAYRSIQPTQQTATVSSGAAAAGARYQGGMGSSGTSSGGQGEAIWANGGVGDCTVTTGYRVLDDGARTPQLRLTLFGKIPTADREKGLGTGEFDVGPGFTVSKWFGDWQPFLESKYLFQGKSDLYQTRDYWAYTIGVSYQLADSALLSVAAKGATPPADDAPGQAEGRLKIAWQIGDATTLESYLTRGFTDGSPDWGGGLSLYYAFGQ